MFDPTLMVVAAKVLEKTLNRALLYDPATRLKLTKIQSARILVECSAPDVTLTFEIHEDNISIKTVDDGLDYDVKLKGKGEDFLLLASTAKPHLSNTNIEVSGKITILNTIKHILSDIELDWEQALTDILGVFAGKIAADSLRASWDWTNSQRHLLKENLSAFLTDEIEVLPSLTELQSFYENVDNLNSAVQRCELRLNRIKSKLETNR